MSQQSNSAVYLHEKVTFWEQLLREGIDHERWGQPEEALSKLSKLKSDIHDLCTSQSSASIVFQSPHTRECTQKLMYCVQDRVQRLRNPVLATHAGKSIPIDAMERVAGTLNGVFLRGEPFPIEIPQSLWKSITVARKEVPTTDLDQHVPDLQPVDSMDNGSKSKPLFSNSADSTKSNKSGNAVLGKVKSFSHSLGNSMGRLLTSDTGKNEKRSSVVSSSLQPFPTSLRGETVIKLELEKIGLKDPKVYIDPFLTITICDDSGKVIGAPQSTPVSLRTDEEHIIFDVVCYLQISLQRLPLESNVFIELHHWKTNEKKLSTRCWSMISREELKKQGPVFLEIYAKPTDYKAQKFTRHSVKPLFMHVHITHQQND